MENREGNQEELVLVVVVVVVVCVCMCVMGRGSACVVGRGYEGCGKEDSR